MISRRILVATSLATAALAAPAGLAWAHHGWSGYDSSKLVRLEGTVQAVSFDNPHAQVTLRTEPKVWRLVLAPPSRMQSRGLPEGSVEVGEAVTVEGYPHRQDAEEFRCERIIVKGKTVELR